jgi:myo-inositol-1(or 4)-monophosphatase
MTNSELNTREFAISLAQRAGELLLEYLRRGLSDDAIRTKTGHFDIVTEADVASERLITAALQEAFPAHAIHAEESAGGGLPVLGVTHDPSASRTYWAEAGAGAWVRVAGQDARLHVSATAEISRALLSTGFVSGRRVNTAQKHAEFAALDLRSQSVRRFGSAAMAMAWVASGHLEAYWEQYLKPWDWFPGWLLIKEAGGFVSDYAGRPSRMLDTGMIASNGQPGIHGVIMEAIAAARARTNIRTLER